MSPAVLHLQRQAWGHSFCCGIVSKTATNGRAVYNNLGYHWATSLLAFLTLVMAPFP
jgi:hypothetical protein